MRDLKADLEICNKATQGPWKRNEKPSFGDWWVYVGGQHICLLPADKKGTHFGEMFKANAEFIAAAREGWPHALERAIKAEAEANEWQEVAERRLDNALIVAQKVCGLETELTLLRKEIEDFYYPRQTLTKLDGKDINVPSKGGER